MSSKKRPAWVKIKRNVLNRKEANIYAIIAENESQSIFKTMKKYGGELL